VILFRALMQFFASFILAKTFKFSFVTYCST